MDKRNQTFLKKILGKRTVKKILEGNTMVVGAQKYPDKGPRWFLSAIPGKPGYSFRLRGSYATAWEKQGAVVPQRIVWKLWKGRARGSPKFSLT